MKKTIRMKSAKMNTPKNTSKLIKKTLKCKGNEGNQT